ncbi:signal transduction histidine kinase [Anoxybacillus voinovskiensis]|uniref:histidine kinase n=2 Tax=Anoxybacteroides voinovskiense TaxID=230470 RepID=A0A840DTH3_9BACL|nr:signal transduction histidine kinase [Anoxybacillus voinovskiensis]GGJ62186.1 two-component sensor histidine kinase [Anoxybacillus voinovskiensis]
MKTNLLACWRKNSRDMFRLTQFRLTALYSGMLMVFLTLFIVIVYSILYVIITHDQERRVNALADQERKAIEDILAKQTMLDFLDEQNVVFLSEDQFFFYVVSPRGQLMMGDEVNKAVRPALLAALQQWEPDEKGLKYIDVQLSAHQHEFSRFRSLDLKLLTAARPIVVHDQLVGILYVGMDATTFSRLFHWLWIVFIGLAVLFIGVAILLSHFMSKRALVPIQEAYNRQREFVANASHELRTPLSVIFSSVEALEMDDDLKVNEFSQKVMHRLREEVKRMTKLINDLLTLARSDSEHAFLEIVKEPFDFRPHAERTVQVLKELADKKDIHLHFNSPASVVGTGDADKLTQLLYILLDNAIKYTPNGGHVSLSLRVEPYKQHQLLVISVKDTGIGIAKEDIGRIFDRFYRADKARTRQHGGHGLGLSIAKWIVDAHRGTIDVQSEVGKGTEFIVKIPF